MVVYVYSYLFTGMILVQIHTEILTWNGTGIFMNIQAYSCSWNFRKAGLSVKKKHFTIMLNDTECKLKHLCEIFFFYLDLSKI